MKASPILAILILAPGLCGAQDKMADALRKGIVEEDTNRNLSAAIQSYQTVIAQYGEDRKAAATAVFRMAECYRKLGKSKEAIAAYSRVVQEFGDQAKLADQSRNQLVKTYKIGGDAAPAEARRKYREVLLEGIQAAQSNWDIIHHQYQLGAVAIQDTYESAAQLAKLKSRLEAFDAGIIPQLPPAPRTPAALAARAQYRASLQAVVDLATKNLTAIHVRYELGSAIQQDVVAAQFSLTDAELELAGLDAGLAQPPNAAPSR